MKHIKLQFIIVLCTVFIQSQSFVLSQNNAIDITSYLPRNYVTNGSVDYTSYLQKGIDENRVVIMPNFPVLVNEKGLLLRNSSEVYFQEFSKVTMKPNSKDTYAIIRIFNVKDVFLHGPNLEGDRYLHKVNIGEWGMGIHITQSENIAIYNPKISNCWGDGIYIGGGKVPSKNITVTNAILSHNRRNGISLTNCERVVINNPIISRTNGTPPMAGIDIEPNKQTDIINFIEINNAKTIENARYGILIELNYLVSSASNDVNITIRGHRDEFSGKGLAIAKIRGNTNRKKAIKGSIIIENAQWIGTNYVQLDQFDLLPNIYYKNIRRNSSR